MSTPLFATNLAMWWAQASLVACAASVVALVLRMPGGRGKLWYWQLTLAACLVLPALAPWQRAAISVNGSGSVFVVTTQVAQVQPAAAHLSWMQIALAVLAGGMLLRFGLLGLGFLKLRRYRLQSVPLAAKTLWASEADIRVSNNVSSPVTFGFRRPVILLPEGAEALLPATRDAILCHEVLHVRRGDWLFTIAEEIVRAVLWFQPAVWWIINEIQLAREQTVDAAAIEILQTRDEYVDALLAVSSAVRMADLAPAPLFLRKRHLKQRLILILKECSMSKTQRICSLAASFALLTGACWTITNAIPLTAAPQYVSDGAGVTVNMNGSTLIHRSGIAYPADLAARHVEGTVQVQVKLDGAGNVIDASILSGPDELRKGVLQSVLNWHFSGSARNTMRQVQVTFEAPKEADVAAQSRVERVVVMDNLKALAQQVQAARPAISQMMAVPNGTQPPRIASMTTAGMSDEASSELLARLPVHAGDAMTPETSSRLTAALHEYDEHLSSTFFMVPSEGVRISIAPSQGAAAIPAAAPVLPGVTQPVRVGGNVMAANLIRRVVPVYPPSAKMERIQGTVRLAATIGPDGSVTNVDEISGLPLLVEAAKDAVRQWLYKPTLLNGQPVAIATTIDVNFTLSNGLPGPAIEQAGPSVH